MWLVSWLVTLACLSIKGTLGSVVGKLVGNSGPS